MPVDTSVNTCKPELTRMSKPVLNSLNRYCAYSNFVRVKHAKSLKYSENKYFIKYIVNLFIEC